MFRQLARLVFYLVLFELFESPMTRSSVNCFSPFVRTILPPEQSQRGVYRDLSSVDSENTRRRGVSGTRLEKTSKSKGKAFIKHNSTFRSLLVGSVTILM